MTDARQPSRPPRDAAGDAGDAGDAATIPERRRPAARTPRRRAPSTRCPRHGRCLAPLAWIATACLLALGLAGCGSNSASAVSSAPGIKVSHAMVPAPASSDVAAAYFTVTNTSSKPDVLESATTDAGKRAQVHHTVTKNGTDTMLPAGPVTIAGGKSFTLSPGGYHLMIMQRTRPLKVGDHVRVTLRFRRAGTVTFTAPVVSETALLSGLQSAMGSMAGRGSGG